MIPLLILALLPKLQTTSPKNSVFSPEAEGGISVSFPSPSFKSTSTTLHLPHFICSFTLGIKPHSCGLCYANYLGMKSQRKRTTREEKEAEEETAQMKQALAISGRARFLPPNQVTLDTIKAAL